MASMDFKKIPKAAFWGTVGYVIGKLVEAIGGWPGITDVAFLALGAIYGFFEE